MMKFRFQAKSALKEIQQGKNNNQSERLKEDNCVEKVANQATEKMEDSGGK